MRIHWAVFGERNSGHALLAVSGNREFAARITQYTDRPGDPPMGIEWGPVHSGFFFADHYVLLRTLPDPTAGRAGMVRSCAAYVPASELPLLGSLLAIFNQFPSNLEKPAMTLEPLEISESALSRTTSDNPPGLVDIAQQLGSPKMVLPMIWAFDEPYLLTVDALWARLPATLRPAFAFAFQFAPEHKIPAVPTLVATLPSLAGRWSTGYFIQRDARNPGNLNTIQSCFIGLSEGSAFDGLLADYGIAVSEFSELNLLSLFLDLIARLTELTFAEVCKAVRIVEKHSKTSKAAAKNRPALFARLCDSVASATPDEIAKLRNLDGEALNDLILPLQSAIMDRIRSMAMPDQLISNFEMAAESPGIWWSQPFMVRVKGLSALPTDAEAQILIQLLVSEKVSKLVSASLGRDAATEDKLLNGLPQKIDHKLATTILQLAQDRKWMRLHAACLLRSRSVVAAVSAHAAVAGMLNDGFIWLYQQLGFIPLLQAACGNPTQGLIEYAGLLLQNHASEVSRDFITECPQWPSILAHCINKNTGGLIGQLRALVVLTLEQQKEAASAFTCLCAACTDRDVTVWFDLVDPVAVLELLMPETKEHIITKINSYIINEVKAGRRIDIAFPNNFEAFLNTETMMLAITSVPSSEAIKAGVAAFRSFPFLSDDYCCRWLIDLFTRTVFNRLQEDEASEVASVLLTADYPKAAAIIKDTAENYYRKDVVPIFDVIRYKYEMTKQYHQNPMPKKLRLPKVIIATALPLERGEVIKHFGTTQYVPDLFADVGLWPLQNPIFEVYVIVTGAGNLEAQRGVLRVLKKINPKIAFFVGVAGGVKDSNIGDVTYSMKVHYYEGGKEDKDGMKSRPVSERSSDDLVQLAHRVAGQKWQPADESDMETSPKAISAVIASGEKVLASTEPQAVTFQQIKAAYNDTQVIEMEGFGFLKACRDENIRHCMVIRGISDKLTDKAESDQQGNQPLAARNAVAFLFSLLRSCPDILKSKKKRGLFGLF
jgi:nucleoside phosphorylase